MRPVGVGVLHVTAIGLQLLRDHDSGAGSQRRLAHGVGLFDGRPSADVNRAFGLQAHAAKRSRLLVFDGEFVD